MDFETDSSKEELMETIESLKEENSKTVDELMEKLRIIEGEQLKTTSATTNSKEKSKNLKEKSNHSKRLH